ncbi:MAG: energy-coupling factor ABC transporter ATP-binding protein [Planctomycetales bacterium]
MAFVQVHRLSHAYPDGTRALEEVSFGIAEGQTVGLVGANGAGKSTLLLHLNGLLPERLGSQGQHHHLPTEENDEGEDRVIPAVEINGLAVAKENLPEIRRQVGLLFQDPDDQLFCPTVLEDVAFGPLQLSLSREEVLERARKSLEEVGLSGYEDRMPHHLSVGERKRVCVAGLLACRPRFLVLDEPTANLDPRGRRRFMNLIQSLDCTKLIASHDLEMIRALCSRVLVLGEGRLPADGPTDELLGDESLMEEHGLEVPLSLQQER